MKNTKQTRLKLWAGIIILVLIVLGISHYGSKEVTGSSQAAGSKTELKIGVLAALSGQYASAGEGYKNGALLSADLYQKEHPDMKIQMVIEDDGFTVQKGLSGFKKLTELDKVDAIIGLSTPVVDGIHTDIQKAGLPYMQFGLQSTGLADDNIFQVSPMPATLIIDFTKYFDKANSFKKIAVVYENTNYDLEFYENFKKTYTGEYEGMILSNKQDTVSVGTKIAKGSYDAVFFMTSPEQGALTVKQIGTLSKKHPPYFFDPQLQTGFADYKRILGGTDQLEGAQFVWVKTDQAKADAFKAAFKEKYNKEPESLADFGFDAFNTLMAARAASVTDWKGNIQDTDTVGASGEIKFDQNNVRIQGISINTIKGGEIVVVK